jgi:arylsulfatase A-like enzyme
MTRALSLLYISLVITAGVMAQAPRPKLVIGLMVDQMRWDYLIRFHSRYGPGGFRRLMDQGFSCDNTMIDYSPSVTACGHTGVYTGSIPAITGIVGNDWYDRYHHKKVYCTEDTTGRMSPDNLLTTTIGDEMNMANNFKSKVVGIALKDRAAILPAGHTATAAFWFDGKSGSFVTSSYYMQELPAWAQQFNSRPNMEKYYSADWKTLYPPGSYSRSTPDDEAWEITAPGEHSPVFPHTVKGLYGKENNVIRATPFGNELTLDFARAAVEGYGLGLGEATDLLAISLSSPDAAGHEYGPNSIEIEDTYLRLDRQLAGFFTWLDGRLGKGNYLLFLTADHGVASSPGYSLAHRMPGGAFDIGRMLAAINDSLDRKFQVARGIESATELQLYLNRDAFLKKGIPLAAAEDYITSVMQQVPGIAGVLSQESLADAPLPLALKNRLINGYNSRRSGDLIILPQPGWKTGSLNGADHGLLYPYDIHIPLLFMGWKIRPGRTDRLVNMTDIAPTLAALLQIQAPSGCIGQPIKEITGR